MLSVRPAGLPLDLDRGIATKTPGRALSKTRNVLQENATRNAPMTVLGKGRKLVQNTPFASKTILTDRVSKDPPGKQVGPCQLKDTPAIRPLGDKTPFPNRTANQMLASGAKIAKPALADGSLRPSSARKHDRLPRSASKVFETPVTDGRHWDVSDIDLEVETSVANQSIEEESLDEIEYMPPKAEDVPYEPPFEMPNYREVGKTLMDLIRSYTLDDNPPSTELTFTVDASEHNFFAQPSLPRREIEDDSPFARAKPKPAVKPQPPAIAKQRSVAVSKPTPRPAAQRTTPATRTVTAPTSRAPSTVRRPPPPTSTSTLRPPAARTSASQPVTRAPTSQSTVRAAPSRATTTTTTTRASSVSRSTPLMRAGASRATAAAAPAVRPTARSTAAVPAKAKAKAVTPHPRPGAATTPRPALVPCESNVTLPGTGRPRSGTITKAAFESNTHVVVHIRNNSLEDVKKDLEGLIVFDDAFDDDDGFRFDV